MSGPLSIIQAAEVAGEQLGDGVESSKGGARKACTHTLRKTSGWCGVGAVRCGRIDSQPASPTTWCEREDELDGGPSWLVVVVAGWLAGWLDESCRSIMLAHGP